jgi:hypothetical protein
MYSCLMLAERCMNVATVSSSLRMHTHKNLSYQRQVAFSVEVAHLEHRRQSLETHRRVAWRVEAGQRLFAAKLGENNSASAQRQGIFARIPN